MSGERWDLHPGGSGAGRMQRVSDRTSTARRINDGPVQDAYNAYLDHLVRAICGCLELPEGRCEKGQALWDTYKETMRP
ncbi:hypothetical protein [Streptomyces sp. NPDC058665]|uniref:hypothetical protein n=1 Tax=Streptomyces sp. NPDC058665 TaxID=3346586 RepID=UPI00364D48E5